jgi:hypothetical protein
MVYQQNMLYLLNISEDEIMITRSRSNTRIYHDPLENITL